jgi:hypothetical protein
MRKYQLSVALPARCEELLLVCEVWLGIFSWVATETRWDGMDPVIGRQVSCGGCVSSATCHDDLPGAAKLEGIHGQRGSICISSCLGTLA